jgi:transcriptional regulator with XRE-family HTH domain
MIRRLGQKVRRLRRRDELSQTELARRIGLSERSRGYISEIENNKKVPPPDVVVRLARVFGVSTDYLLRDEIALTAEG